MAVEALGQRLLAALVSACGRVTGTDYHYDLATDSWRIRKGRFAPTTPPADGTCVALARLPSSLALGEASLTGATRRLVFQIQGWARPETDSLDDRQAAADRLERDLLLALWAEQRDETSALAHVSQLEVSGDAMDGAEAGLVRPCGFVSLLLTLTTHLEIGEVP